MLLTYRVRSKVCSSGVPSICQAEEAHMINCTLHSLLSVLSSDYRGLLIWITMSCTTPTVSAPVLILLRLLRSASHYLIQLLHWLQNPQQESPNDQENTRRYLLLLLNNFFGIRQRYGRVPSEEWWCIAVKNIVAKVVVEHRDTTEVVSKQACDSLLNRHLIFTL